MAKIINWNQVPREHTDAAGSEKLYVNIDSVKSGGKSCKYHAHARSEEFFLILQGSGTLRVPDDVIAYPDEDAVYVRGTGVFRQGDRVRDWSFDTNE